MVFGVEQERDYLEGERLRLSDVRDYYRSENEILQRIVTRARDQVETLEAEDQDRRAEITDHLITIDTLRYELEQAREQRIETLDENAELRSQMRRQEAQMERLRQLVPDWEDRLAESDSDGFGDDHEMWHAGLGANVELEPVEPVTDDEMYHSDWGSEDDEEPSEHDDDEDYDADAEREDSSDGSDGDSGDHLVPESGWIVE